MYLDFIHWDYGEIFGIIVVWETQTFFIVS